MKTNNPYFKSDLQIYVSTLTPLTITLWTYVPCNIFHFLHFSKNESQNVSFELILWFKGTHEKRAQKGLLDFLLRSSFISIKYLPTFLTFFRKDNDSWQGKKIWIKKFHKHELWALNELTSLLLYFIYSMFWQFVKSEKDWKYSNMK